MENHKPIPIIAHGNRHYALDLSSKRITFLDKRFYVTESGMFVPSVTTILECYPKGFGFYEWLKKNGEDSDEIRDEAGRKGSIVHNLTERYDKGEKITLLDGNGDIAFKMVEWSMFERWVEFRNANPEIKISVIERNHTSEQLGFGGTIDRVIEFRGKRYILDIKTANNMHEHYWLQAAAYQRMVNELCLLSQDKQYIADNYIDGVCIWYANAKTRTNKMMDVPSTGACDLASCQGKGWQLITRTAGEGMYDWDRFLATQKLWLAENSDASPRNTSYCIEYEYKEPIAEGRGIDLLNPADKAAAGTSPNKKKPK